MDNPDKKTIIPRKPGQPPVTGEQLNKFLDALAQCGNVTQSCEIADFTTVTAYRHYKNNPEFAKAWDEAAKIGARALEDEARRRGFQGWEEPVFYEGEQVASVRKFSDTLLIFILKAHFPEKYRERFQAELTGPGGGPIQTQNLDDMAKALPDKDLRLLRDILARVAAPGPGPGPVIDVEPEPEEKP